MERSLHHNFPVGRSSGWQRCRVGSLRPQDRATARFCHLLRQEVDVIRLNRVNGRFETKLAPSDQGESQCAEDDLLRRLGKRRDARSVTWTG